MQSAKPQQRQHMDKAIVYKLVRGLAGGDSGYPGDDNPLPHGPWDPIIRKALARDVLGPHPEPWHTQFDGGRLNLSAVLGPQPEPWREAFLRLAASINQQIWEVVGGGPAGPGGPGAARLAEAGLNPQPLPPRAAHFTALAQEVTERAELYQTFADLLQGEGEQRGGRVAASYLAKFADEYCGTYPHRWPFPWPPPPWWDEKLSGIDLLVLATEFDHAAQLTASEHLRAGLQGAADNLAEVGMQRLQG